MLALFAQVALVQFWIGDYAIAQVYGLQPHHLLICEALGLDSSWYEATAVHKSAQNRSFQSESLNVGFIWALESSVIREKEADCDTHPSRMTGLTPRVAGLGVSVGAYSLL